LVLAATALCGQSQPQNEGPRPARSRAEELLDRWNDIGNKLVAKAQDFPKRSTKFKCRATSDFARIFSTPPHWIRPDSQDSDQTLRHGD